MFLKPFTYFNEILLYVVSYPFCPFSNAGVGVFGLTLLGLQSLYTCMLVQYPRPQTLEVLKSMRIRFITFVWLLIPSKKPFV